MNTETLNLKYFSTLTNLNYIYTNCYFLCTPHQKNIYNNININSPGQDVKRYPWCTTR